MAGFNLLFLDYAGMNTTILQKRIAIMLSMQTF
jgi:hypothetical protein